jgi:hypothetical protein
MTRAPSIPDAPPFDIATVIALALVLPIGLIPLTLPWFALAAKLVPVAILFAAQGFALDIAFLGVGGDTQLIVARLLDTLVGCGAVLPAVFALRRYRAWRGIESTKQSDTEVAEPAHGEGAAAHDGAAAAEPGAHL